MADTFKFELVSPERLLISDDVETVVVPGADGNFEVMSGHAPFISTLRAGVLEIDGKDDNKVYVRGGFAEAGADSLTVLAQQAVNLSDLDKDALAKEIASVEGEIKEADEGSDAFLSAQQAFDQLKQLQDQL